MADPRLRYPYRHGAEPEGFVGADAVWRGTAPPPTRNLARAPGGVGLAWQQPQQPQQQQQPMYQRPAAFDAPPVLGYGDAAAYRGASVDDEGGDDDEIGGMSGSDGAYSDGEGGYSDDDGDDGAYSPPASPAWGGGYVAPTRAWW
ncbi:hypothetical protein pdul_cds_32 [Pandoravirus dulcis]|uniref:Uncharacterized protein n=1 Tax=Pandoravirus dulcis TaxID=1349409 RepID=S4VVA4_9VIRU|nr:hypothetical protein pdul_cds_32 [Pandoravirus dulcis]AGO81909.1 hypothetical protein pdul_cds_32 [Pandoravirus dulcis]